jgi:2-oxoglutarate ferredoxin oxidoreductase subunit beta
MLKKIKQYLRLDHFPHIWCPGCGNGIILQAFLRAVIDLDLNKDEVVVVSGIGCSSRSVGYLDFDTLHTAHGRALAFATGIKLAKPKLNVVILAGDGDIAAIGGNHLIHAARRNIDLTVVVFNNFTYGMTSGQYSPLTPTGDTATTAPYGNIEQEFDLCGLAQSAGATFVARSTTYHAVQLPKIISQGIAHHGFSLVEVIVGCPTYYGKMNQMRSPQKMLKWQRDHAVNLKQFAMISEEEKLNKFPIGIIHSVEKPEYTDEYSKIIQKAQASAA